MKNIFLIILVALTTNVFSQDRTCYVVYNHSENNKKIYIDEVPTNELNRYKLDHLNGNIDKTRGWFTNKQRLYKKDFAELKDNIDSKLDADYFIISLVSNIDLPKGYELILAPHIERYESEIKDAITRKRYSNINSEFSRTQGKSGTKMYEREYEEVLKNNLFSDQVSEVVVQGFDSEGTISRVDFVAKLKGTDDIVFIEVKTGNARLSKNQDIVYSRACIEGCKLKSRNDVLGFKTGSTIKPVKIYLYRDGVPEVLYPK